jgi:lipopolysaccharide/colanic/teichoic acid biosynthesis glycosyltransferase
MAVAAAGLVLLAPAMAVVAIAIRAAMGRPVLFAQVRTGRGERLFRLFKFRTMRDAHSHEFVPLPDSARLTPLGQFLRRTSLDELPQLWNVLKGDMSLVGPRPLLPQYLPRYSLFQRRRHEVVPGITGWAQVSGRNAVDWERRFELDVWYVEHRGFWLDLRILARTALMVLKREDTNQEGHASMPEFAGTPDRSDGR